MNTDTSNGAAEELGGDTSQPAAQDESNTFFLPADFLQGKDYKPGDTLTLKVVSQDKDGDFEVELADGDNDADDKNNLSLGDDLRQSGAFSEGEA